jgi:hypothetical protein
VISIETEPKQKKEEEKYKNNINNAQLLDAIYSS